MIVDDFAAIARASKNLKRPVEYVTFITYGYRESLSDIVSKLFKDDLGSADEKAVAAFNDAIASIDRSSFPEGNEGSYQHMLATMRAARTALTAQTNGGPA